MDNQKQKGIAEGLFDASWDNESIAHYLELDESLVEQWRDEYDTLNGIAEDQALTQEAIDLRKSELEFQKLKFDAEQREKLEQELRAKRGKVISMKKLFVFLKSNSQGFKWKFEELSLYIRKLRTLQTQVEELCGHDIEVFENLFMWNRLQDLIDKLQELLQQYEEGDTIKMNFDENDILFLDEALEIEDFDEEVEEEIEEETSLSGLLEDEIKPSRY
ncbi:hypothetical protein [uncultured Roseivirga sp.]|uniref:hypothetical protein n=1 Tax=uncultured Roseivirga sp. TaxID=543088 RepID=UPI0030DB94BD|tara:strand:+ start:7814 stop:8467 length:654 start_codon:yes stop_codon:yes gene_type:complete